MLNFRKKITRLLMFFSTALFILSLNSSLAIAAEGNSKLSVSDQKLAAHLQQLPIDVILVIFEYNDHEIFYKHGLFDFFGYYPEDRDTKFLVFPSVIMNFKHFQIRDLKHLICKKSLYAKKDFFDKEKTFKCLQSLETSNIEIIEILDIVGVQYLKKLIFDQQIGAVTTLKSDLMLNKFFNLEHLDIAGLASTSDAVVDFRQLKKLRVLKGSFNPKMLGLLKTMDLSAIKEFRIYVVEYRPYDISNVICQMINIEKLHVGMLNREGFKEVLLATEHFKNLKDLIIDASYIEGTEEGTMVDLYAEFLPRRDKKSLRTLTMTIANDADMDKLEKDIMSKFSIEKLIVKFSQGGKFDHILAIQRLSKMVKALEVSVFIIDEGDLIRLLKFFKNTDDYELESLTLDECVSFMCSVTVEEQELIEELLSSDSYKLVNFKIMPDVDYDKK